MELMTNLAFPFVEEDQVLYVKQTDASIFLILQVDSRSSECPRCKHPSQRRHSRYTRRVHDLAIAERPVMLQVITSKWFCDNSLCETRIYTERLPWLKPYNRRTDRLNQVIETIAFASNCIAAEKVCRSLHITISHDAILKLIKDYDPEVRKPGGFPFRGNR